MLRTVTDCSTTLLQQSHGCHGPHPWGGILHGCLTWVNLGLPFSNNIPLCTRERGPHCGLTGHKQVLNRKGWVSPRLTNSFSLSWHPSLSLLPCTQGQCTGMNAMVAWKHLNRHRWCHLPAVSGRLWEQERKIVILCYPVWAWFEVTHIHTQVWVSNMTHESNCKCSLRITRTLYAVSNLRKDYASIFTLIFKHW
jgi:hypothetical protein